MKTANETAVLCAQRWWGAQRRWRATSKLTLDPPCSLRPNSTPAQRCCNVGFSGGLNRTDCTLPSPSSCALTRELIINTVFWPTLVCVACVRQPMTNARAWADVSGAGPCSAVSAGGASVLGSGGGRPVIRRGGVCRGFRRRIAGLGQGELGLGSRGLLTREGGVRRFCWGGWHRIAGGARHEHLSLSERPVR